MMRQTFEGIEPCQTGQCVSVMVVIRAVRCDLVAEMQKVSND